MGGSAHPRLHPRALNLTSTFSLTLTLAIVLTLALSGVAATSRRTPGVDRQMREVSALQELFADKQAVALPLALALALTPRPRPRPNSLGSYQQTLGSPQRLTLVIIPHSQPKANPSSKPKAKIKF